MHARSAAEIAFSPFCVCCYSDKLSIQPTAHFASCASVYLELVTQRERKGRHRRVLGIPQKVPTAPRPFRAYRHGAHDHEMFFISAIVKNIAPILYVSMSHAATPH
jgi:hypothetical protein